MKTNMNINKQTSSAHLSLLPHVSTALVKATREMNAMRFFSQTNKLTNKQHPLDTSPSREYGVGESYERDESDEIGGDACSQTNKQTNKQTAPT